MTNVETDLLGKRVSAKRTKYFSRREPHVETMTGTIRAVSMGSGGWSFLVRVDHVEGVRLDPGRLVSLMFDDTEITVLDDTATP